MPRLRAALIILLFALGGASLSAWGDDQANVDVNWASLGEQAAAQGLPVAILFASADCGYCERLKQDLLHPAFQGGKLTGQALIGELSIHARGKITDFDDERIRAPLFVQRYRVFATPTLVLVGPNGDPLGPALVGFADQDAYAMELEQALEHATAQMRAPDYRNALARRPH